MRVYTRNMNQACYCILLRKLSRRLTARYDEALAPFGVGVAQFSLLRSIGRKGKLSVTELAEIAELDRSTVGRNCRLLLKSGFVAAAHGDDQREAVYRLSGDGARLLEEASPVWERVQAEIESELDPAQLKLLGSILETI